MNTKIIHYTGWRRVPIYLRIILHVWLHLSVQCLRGRFSPLAYPMVLRRALIFLFALRHNKIVRLGDVFKLQLYVPAYPSPAFFHSIEKFYRAQPGPLTVVFSMTKACSYNCEHCYQKRDGGADLEEGRMIASAQAMQELGVSMFDIEGGEPLLRIERLVNLLEALDDRAELWINTTGAGLTDAMAKRLKLAGLFGVMISLHSSDAAVHDHFTGKPGAFGTAFDAARIFAENGVMSAFNSCPSEEDLLQDRFISIMDVAEECGCGYVQLIHRKPSGAWLDQQDKSSTDSALITRMHELHAHYNDPGPKTNAPAVSAQAFEEDSALFGCTAGGIDRFYLGADGEVQPCEFLNVSFGNVNDEEFLTIFARMRAHFDLPRQDWLCCTMSESINAMMVENKLTRTPVPWSIFKNYVNTWDRGKPTTLYERLNLYDSEEG